MLGRCESGSWRCSSPLDHPSLGLTLLVTLFLSRSVAELRNPETERALAQSLEVIRNGIERLAATPARRRRAGARPETSGC